MAKRPSLTPADAAKQGGKLGELKARFVFLIGALIVTAYLLALWAYRISTVGYAGAIREVGVVMAAFAGWQLLGEPFGRWRVTGAVVIFAGIVVIALFG